MTTAPTPEEVHALAARLEHCVAKWGKQDALSLEAYSAVKMMRRLQASYQALQTENERLRMELVAEARAAAEHKLRADQLAQQHRMQAQMHAQATQQLAELEARKPLPVSDWIDADERRPEAYLDVLVVIDGKWVTTGEWLHAQKTWCWEQTGDEPDESRVTHWMHMPSPPAHGITGGLA